MKNMEGGSEKVICQICGKEFSSVSAKNRHLRDIHREKPVAYRKNRLIKCPICPEEKKDAYEKHDMLIDHFQQIHSLNIKTSLFNFKNEEEFETWRSLDNRNVDYIKRSHRKSTEGLVVYYECNRSNYSGFTSKCNQRSVKTGGSIKMSGYCPSRILVKITHKAVDVKFVETHVGHDNSLRSKRLTKDQQEMIASKLTAGVTKERILEDSRTITNNKLERINVLKRSDFAYIIQKFNIEKRRHNNDMVATALKEVQEWNSQGSNYVLNAPIDSITEYGVVKEQTKLQFDLLEEDVGRNIAKMIYDAYNLQCTNASTRKRKIEKQLYFPNKE